MIVKHERLQYLECDICGETIEVKRKTLANPETVLIMIEQLTEDHKPCEEFKTDPERARIERGYKVRMRCEMRRRR